MLARCASLVSVGGYVRYTSVNRETILVRFLSEPQGARAILTCEKAGGTAFEKIFTTPANARLPLPANCAVTFDKEGFMPATVEFEPVRMAYRSASCDDPGVWCADFESIPAAILSGILYGVSGFVARPADPIRHGFGNVNVTLQPLPEEDR